VVHKADKDDSRAASPAVGPDGGGEEQRAALAEVLGDGGMMMAVKANKALLTMPVDALRTSLPVLWRVIGAEATVERGSPLLSATAAQLSGALAALVRPHWLWSLLLKPD
jgi:hypothetical protein